MKTRRTHALLLFLFFPSSLIFFCLVYWKLKTWYRCVSIRFCSAAYFCLRFLFRCCCWYFRNHRLNCKAATVSIVIFRMTRSPKPSNVINILRCVIICMICVCLCVCMSTCKSNICIWN